MSGNDITMKFHLKHGYNDLIKAGKMRQEELPWTLKGNKKSCSGRLPLHISPPSFQACLNNRVKNVDNKLYLLSNMSLK